MKKSSKIIMILVAVVLTFTLLSSCLVSSTMARYVITKDATTTVSLQKFGVKLTIANGTDFASSGATINPSSPTASTLTATVTVPLVPGSDYDDIVQFVPSIDTKAAVATNIKVKAEVTTVGSTNLYSSKYYVPTDVYINGTATNVAFKNNATAATATGYLSSAINTLLASKVGAVGDDGFYTGALVAKGATSVDASKTIKIGVKCPLDSANAENEVMTALAESGATVTIKYTVSLEQAS